MSNSLITTTKAEVKAIVAKLPPALRMECDKVFTLANEAAPAVDAVRKQTCIAINAIALDEKAVEKAGYKTFRDLAADIFGMAPVLATQCRKTAEKFYCAEKQPTVTAWYSQSKLAELLKVDSERLDKDAASGLLKPSMTNAELRAYADAVKAEALEDGTAKLVKMYDAHITAPNNPAAIPFTGTYEELLDAMRKICRSVLDLPADTVIEVDRFGSFNPHVTITPEKGKPHDAKGVFLAYSTFMVCAWYTPTPRAKSPKKRENSPQDAVQMLKSLTPEQRAQILQMLSGGAYDPVEDDE